MSVDGSNASKNINNIYSLLINFVASVEKGNSSDIALKLRQVESCVSELRESIDSITDIASNEECQRAKIESLVRQIKAKDALIASFKDASGSF